MRSLPTRLLVPTARARNGIAPDDHGAERGAGAERGDGPERGGSAERGGPSGGGGAVA